jgi:hypothetical protein
METSLKIQITTIKVTTVSKDGMVSSRSHYSSKVLVKVKNGVPVVREKELASA